MQFRKIIPTKIDSAQAAEAVTLRICLALAALLVCLWPQTAAAQIKGYAVQVAALRSQQSADELMKGLIARGVDAYWVEGASPGTTPQRGGLYRVRVGKFATIESAYRYAERLLDSGLLDAYAIMAYEPPASAGRGSGAPEDSAAKVQSFAPRKESGKESGNRKEAIDLVATIGARGWLLLSSQSVRSTPQPRQSALNRELVRLAVAVGARGWSLNHDIAGLLAAPSPPDSTAGAGGSFPAITPAPPVTRASSTNLAAPEGGRRPLAPATSAGTATSALAAAYLPRLQGVIEMREGRMWMKLRNLDADRSFSGMARITLSDERNQQDVAPRQFTLPPDSEESFPVDEATMAPANWILMVYDERGVARLVRGASLAPKQPPQNPAQNTVVAQTAADQNDAAQGPPSYVTGVYDATGWTLSQNAPESPNPASQTEKPQNNGLVPIPDNSNSAGANSPGDGAATPPAPPSPPVAPGQLTVVPRQIAVTAENVTMEFDISAPAPPGYISVTLRAGDYQDTRQALMSTPQGRVPFLIPIKHTAEGFSYEIKNEALQSLASGNGDFRGLARGN